jgi:hypothetical protein
VLIETLLERLEGVRRSGDGWVALCPCHEDRDPSLSLREVDGKILFHCHAGCDQDRLYEALLGGQGDWQPRQRSVGSPVAVYDYPDESGQLLFQTLRYEDASGRKTFRQRHVDPESGVWVYNLTDVRRVLYHLPEVLYAVGQGMTVYVCEGEKDADAIRSLGLPATCNPLGAGKWRDEFSQLLRGTKVVIVAHRDEPGRNHADRVRNSLISAGAERVWVLQAKVGNDAYDHVAAGFTVRDFVERKARGRRGIVTSAEMAQAGREELTYTESDLPAYRFSPVIPIDFRPGRVYAVGAYTSDGKTRFGLQGYRTLATLGVHVGYFSLEMSFRDLRNILVAHRGVPLRLSERPWELRESPVMLEAYHAALDEIAAWSAEVVVEAGMNADKIVEYTRDREYDVIVIDHLHRFGWGDRRNLEEQIQQLTNLSLDTNIPIVLLCQLRRSTASHADKFPEPTLSDLRETGVIEQEASMCLSLWRQRVDNVTPLDRSKVRILKNRHTSGHDDSAGHYWDVGFDIDRQYFTTQPSGWDGHHLPGLAAVRAVP